MSEKKLANKQAAPLRQQVTFLLKNDILEGVFLPGDRLVEANLCDRYGVSRTVVREVLRLLESDHLVSVIPMQGPIVTLLTDQDISNLYSVRARVESMLIELFIKNANETLWAGVQKLYDTLDSSFLEGSVEDRWVYKDTFYALLAEGANNNALEDIVEHIQSRVGLFKHFAFTYEDRVKRGHEDLALILSAILARDIPLACRYNDEHLIDAGEAAIFNYHRRLTHFNTKNA